MTLFDLLHFKMYNKSLTNLIQLSSEEVSNFINSFDTVLTDCDGVLWLENEVIKGAPEVLNRLRDIGKRVYYVTNNSTKVRDEYVAKATQMGFKAKKEEIISAAYLVANYLKSQNFNKKVYLVGSNGVGQELDLVGIKHIGIGPDVVTGSIHDVAADVKLDPDVGAVVVAFDQHFSFIKMLKASSYLKNPNILFIASNTDEVFPFKSDLVMPGTGSLVRCIETVTGRKATVLGKPEAYIADAIIEQHAIDPARTLMIGDRCNTDILLGARCGFQTLLVLTGVSTIHYVQELKKSDDARDVDLVPDVYLDTISDLSRFLR